jgi:hypothetical protein
MTSAKAGRRARFRRPTYAEHAHMLVFLELTCATSGASGHCGYTLFAATEAVNSIFLCFSIYLSLRRNPGYSTIFPEIAIPCESPRRCAEMRLLCDWRGLSRGKNRKNIPLITLCQIGSPLCRGVPRWALACLGSCQGDGDTPSHNSKAIIVASAAWRGSRLLWLIHAD